jgi:hypothetical protein
MPFCKSCDARIEFQRSESGRYIPVNPEVIPYSEAQIGEILVTSEGRTVTVQPDVELSVKGRISHFATCPQAAQHRRGNA